MRSLCLSLFLVLSFAASGAASLIHNVQGYTLDENDQLISFSHMVFDGGKVLAVGDTKLAKQYPEAQIIDGKGKVLLPGLIDAHGHLLGLGQNLLQVDVRDLSSARASAEKVRQYAQQNPKLDWIVGRGWNQVLWPGQKFPTSAQLDEYVNEKPVWLERVDGHAAWVNSKALKIAGITRDTLDPPGGKIERDTNGNPSGVLIDTAMYLLSKHLPKDSAAMFAKQLSAAGQHLLSVGITSMHDAGISEKVSQFYQERASKRTLPLRIYAMLAATEDNLAALLSADKVQDQDDFLSIQSVKAYGDGALGSRGAAMLQPYSDDPENSGLLVTKKTDLAPLFDLVMGSGFQLNFHAIGDRANRLALEQFADTYSRIGGKALRNRIEHAQVVNLDDFGSFKTLNIIPSMQPTHATSDKNMAEDRIGKARLEGAYAWQRFLKQGSRLAFGSDFPVELANPFYGLHAAVTRQDRQNQPKEGWIPEQGLSIEQAFRAFTLDAAYAAHQEKILGGLTKGKWADFILVDQDIFNVPAKDIWRTKVLQTWVAGRQVYQADQVVK